MAGPASIVRADRWLMPPRSDHGMKNIVQDETVARLVSGKHRIEILNAHICTHIVESVSRTMSR
jgi:hypothetical protein